MSREFRVLAIDDEPEMLKLLETLLSRRGFDVVVARDAYSGLRAAYQTHPDAILLDVMMPGMDGFDVCRRLKEVTDAPIAAKHTSSGHEGSRGMRPCGGLPEYISVASQRQPGTKAGSA